MTVLPCFPELSLNKLHEKKHLWHCAVALNSLYRIKKSFSNHVFDYSCSPSPPFSTAAAFKFRKYDAKSHHFHFWLRISESNLDKIQLLHIQTCGCKTFNMWWVMPIAEKMQRPSAEWVSQTGNLKMQQQTRKCSSGGLVSKNDKWYMKGLN